MKGNVLRNTSENIFLLILRHVSCFFFLFYFLVPPRLIRPGVYRSNFLSIDINIRIEQLLSRIWLFITGTVILIQTNAVGIDRSIWNILSDITGISQFLSNIRLRSNDNQSPKHPIEMNDQEWILLKIFKIFILFDQCLIRN